MDSKIENELKEKNFISSSKKKSSFPIYSCLIFLLVLGTTLWGFDTWRLKWAEKSYEHNPFLRVTNREFSTFLWFHPEYMKANMKSSPAYLPDMGSDKITLLPAYAEEYVKAPPEVLFRYHIWSELLKNYLPNRPILAREFKEFLSYAKEWTPEYYPGASEEYKVLVATLGHHLPSYHLEGLLPKEVRIAFQGWKNFFYEGEAINNAHPTYKEMSALLKEFPHLARNYWRNILQESKPDYLIYQLHEVASMDAIIPENELIGFLKLYFYNAKMSKLGL